MHRLIQSTFDAAATAVDHVRAGFPARDAATIAIATATMIGQPVDAGRVRAVQVAAELEAHAMWNQAQGFVAVKVCA